MKLSVPPFVEWTSVTLVLPLSEPVSLCLLGRPPDRMEDGPGSETGNPSAGVPGTDERGVSLPLLVEPPMRESTRL